jgi:WD40 repeat protein
MTTRLALRSRVARHWQRGRRLLIWRPWGTIAASLAAVLFFVAALGPFFLRQEFAGESARSIVDCYLAAEGRETIQLTWPKDPESGRALRRQIAAHTLSGDAPPRILLGSAIDPRCMSVSADGRFLFAGTWDGSWYVVELGAAELGASEGPAIPAGKHPVGIADLACSNDGQTLVTRGESCVCAWNLATRTIRWQRNDLQLGSWDLHPDSRSLVCVVSTGGLLEVDLATGRTIRRLRFDGASLQAVAISPCGSYLAATAWDGSLTLVDFQTGRGAGRRGKTHVGMAGMSRIVVFSPCGRYLVTLHERDTRTLAIWSIHEGCRLGELRGHSGAVVGAAFHAGGGLYSWATDGSLRWWDFKRDTEPRVARMATHARSLARDDSRSGRRS